MCFVHVDRVLKKENSLLIHPALNLSRSFRGPCRLNYISMMNFSVPEVVTLGDSYYLIHLCLLVYLKDFLICIIILTEMYTYT